MLHKGRKALRKRMAGAAFLTWIVLLGMRGICFANPIAPSAPYYGSVRLFAVYAAASLSVLMFPTGLYLLLWRLVTFSAKREKSIKDHVLIISYVIIGLLLGQYYIGFVFLGVGLIKGTKAFFADVRPEKGRLTGIRTAVCVWCYNAVLIAVWRPFSYFLAGLDGFGGYAYETTAFSGVQNYLSFVHWYPSYDLIIFLVLCAVWIFTILVYWDKKGGEEFVKIIPDIITVFGMLFTGYWFWYFGGIIFYFLALGFAMCFLSGFPAYYRELFLPGHPKEEKAVEQDVAEMDAAEIIKELEDSGESADRTLSLRKLRKQLVRKRLSSNIGEEKQADREMKDGYSDGQ
ncbi:MAG: hypothetical protein J5643_08120 [Lachnospiraceae bacterium]|nr:hypothetical protein [Lachnospiraceae bacterium]